MALAERRISELLVLRGNTFFQRQLSPRVTSPETAGQAPREEAELAPS